MTITRSYQITLGLLFIFSMHFFMPTPGGYGLYLAFNTVSWIFVSIIIGLGLWKISQQQGFLYHKFHLIFLAAFILLCLPLFYGAPHSDYAIPRLIGLFAGLAFSFTIFQFKLSRNQHLSILALILIGIAIQSLISIFQVIALKAGHESVLQVINEWPIVKALFLFIPLSKQPSGVFLQTNVMSSFMATGVVLSLYLSAQKQWLAEQPKWLILIFLCQFSCAFSLYFIQSKTGIYGAIAGVLLLSPYLYKFRHKHLITAAVLIILGISSATLMKPESQTQANAPLFEAQDVRVDIFKVGFSMIKENPIAGYGYGGFSKEYREFHLQQKLKNPELAMPLKNLNHPHNEVLFWGIEGGIVAILGLTLLAIAYLSIFYKVHLLKTISFIGLITPILLHTQTEYPFYHSTIHWLVFLLLINCSLFFCQEKDTLVKAFRFDFIAKSFALIVPTSGTIFMLSTLQSSYYIEQYEAAGAKHREILLKAYNLVVWRDYLEQRINNQNLLIAVMNQNSKGIKDYIHWGTDYVARKPSEKVYNNMILAFQSLHKMKAEYDKEEGVTIIRDAMRLFPERDYF